MEKAGGRALGKRPSPGLGLFPYGSQSTQTLATFEATRTT